MKDRITELMKREELTAAKFADDIGVQRSSISHIISGRNNPSLDFIQKILARYKEINTEWLIMGIGEMYKVPKKVPTLFDSPSEKKADEEKPKVVESQNSQIPVADNTQNNKTQEPASVPPQNSVPPPVFFDTDNKVVQRIVIFYTDKTFSVYTPSD